MNMPSRTIDELVLIDHAYLQALEYLTNGADEEMVLTVGVRLEQDPRYSRFLRYLRKNAPQFLQTMGIKTRDSD